MRFSPSFLEDIKARLPVSEVVRRRVKLVKAGREWRGLSPFNTEKTPSFFVNDQKMAWFDFSSGKNGNVFDFVMATEGLSFPETVERLAQEAGLTMPSRSEETERQEQRRAGLHEVLEWAAAFFETELRSERGGKARTYLDKRGITTKSRADFRIGYAPGGRYALRDALAAKGASVEVMCEAGLLIHGDDIPVPYDKFRDRIMFPIADRGGRVVAFGGRALEKDVQAKYLNSPETPVFHKGRMLFNHHRARKAAHDVGRVIVVEGYIDVLAMHAAGFPETVASLGTALTEEQAALLWAMTPQPMLCFDGDKAGRKAAYRAADMALPLIAPDRTFAFALLPEGQDPDDLIRASGAAAMQEALASALPLVDILWSRANDRPLSTPEQKAGLERDLRLLADSISDPALRHHYREAFKDRIRQQFAGSTAVPGSKFARTGMRGPKQKYQERSGYLSMAPVQPSPSLLAANRSHSGENWPPRETMIMVILLSHPALVADNSESLATLVFSSKELSLLRDRLLDCADYPAWNAVDSGSAAAILRAETQEREFATTLEKLDRCDASTRWYARPEASVVDAGHVLRQSLALHHQTHALNEALRLAQESLAAEQSEANMARLRDIQDQRNALAGKEAAIEGFGTSSGRHSETV